MPGRSTFAGLLFMALCSCSSALDRVDGKIVDADDAAPLSDVIVVAARWQASGIPSPVGSPKCAHVELTRTDTAGRFHFDSWTPPPVPLWKQLPTDKSWTILTVYKSGFVLPVGTPPITVGANFNGIVKMKRFKQPFEAQLQVMHEAEVASRCNTAQSYEAQRPLLSQLAADAAAAARTPEQLETAQREFDFRANDDEFNRSVHPDANHDSPPPPPSPPPSIIGIAPKGPPAGGAQH